MMLISRNFLDTEGLWEYHSDVLRGRVMKRVP